MKSGYRTDDITRGRLCRPHDELPKATSDTPLALHLPGCPRFMKSQARFCSLHVNENELSRSRVPSINECSGHGLFPDWPAPATVP